MSRYEVIQDNKKFVFGWDPPLRSYFLQVHDLTLDEADDERIRFVLGADVDSIYTDAFRFCKVVMDKEGLPISHAQVWLLQEDQAHGR